MFKKYLGFSIIIAALMGQVYAVAGPVPSENDPMPLSCKDPGPEYYAIDLVTTRNVPGTGQGTGKAVMKFEASPFGISITKDGSYQHRLDIKLEKVNKPKDGRFVAWVTTPNLDKVKRIGELDKNFSTTGTVEWNKYLVVISLEKSPGELGERWQGPIAFRGLSKSGFMHTMAGHGPFEQEPCAKYGYY